MLVKVKFYVYSDEGRTAGEKTLRYSTSTTCRDIVESIANHVTGTLAGRLECNQDELGIAVQVLDEVFLIPDDEALVENRHFTLKAAQSQNVVEAVLVSKAKFESRDEPRSPRTLPPRRKASSRELASPQSPRPVLGAIHMVYFSPTGGRYVVTMTYRHGEKAGTVMEDGCERLNTMLSGISIDAKMMCLRYRQSDGRERVFEYEDRLPVPRDASIYPELFLCPSKVAKQIIGERMPVRHRPVSFTEDQLALDASLEFKEARIRSLLADKRKSCQRLSELQQQLAAGQEELRRLEESHATMVYLERDTSRLLDQIAHYETFLESHKERELMLVEQLQELKSN